MDHSQRQTIWKDTKQALTSSRKLKLYQAPSQITRDQPKKKKLKNMQIDGG